MKAITYDRFGPPEVLQIEDMETPLVGDEDLLIEVHATSVTTADWRLRAAVFPRGMRLIGRLVVGLFRPRHRLTGLEFSGRVVAVGPEVTRFAVGDEVFGHHPKGVNAEQIVVPQTAAITHKPAALSHAEAVALPFGAVTALHFLVDMVKVQPGERVLIMGASGGVGVYLVQVAKHLGAEVTGVCSTGNLDLVRSLGADHVIDYTRQDPRESGQTWDVIVDPVHKTRFGDYRAHLSPKGRHAFIEGGLLEAFQSLFTGWRSGPRVVWGVAPDSPAAMQRLCEKVEAGALRPVIGHRFPMTEVVEAHRVVDRRHRKGAVILDWPAAAEATGTVPLRRVGSA